ncbi:hypothetical protein CCS92_32240, partial [Methylobacterium radiotolerans]
REIVRDGRALTIDYAAAAAALEEAQGRALAQIRQLDWAGRGPAAIAPPPFPGLGGPAPPRRAGRSRRSGTRRGCRWAGRGSGCAAGTAPRDRRAPPRAPPVPPAGPARPPAGRASGRARVCRAV